MDSELAQRWAELQPRLENGFTHLLGIRFSLDNHQVAQAELTITEQLLQPFGLTHGGVYASLAESVASVNGFLTRPPEAVQAVGQQVSLNLLRPAKLGDTILATSKAIHLGNKSQVWDITMTLKDEPMKPLAVARITLALVSR